MHSGSIQSIAQDAAHGFRVLRRRPIIFASAAGVIALTSGMMISLVVLADRLLVKPLPIDHPDRLVQVVRRTGPGGFNQDSFSWALIQELRGPVNARGVLLLAGYPGEDFVSFSNGFQPERIRSATVDAAALQALRVRAAIGRVFDRRDAAPGSERVALLSYEYWRTRFGGDRGVIGRRVWSRKTSFMIAGVLESGFSELDVGSSPDLWLPMIDGQGGRVLVVLNPGVQSIQLESALRPVFDDFLKHEPVDRQGTARYLERKLTAASASSGLSAWGIRKRFEKPLFTLALASGLLLVIGCGNVVLLLLTLEASRRGEMAVRASLGASRSRQIRQVVTEMSVFVAAGCMLGCGLAPIVTNVLVSLASDPNRPLRIAWQWDGRVGAVLGLFWVSITLLCALIPAIRASRELVIDSIRNRSYGEATARRGLTLRDLLILSQTTLALVLLVSAGLLRTTWLNLDQIDPGFDKDKLLVANLQWDREGSRAYRDASYRALLDRAAALPGVSSVTLSGWSYFDNASARASILPDAGGDVGNAPLCEFMAVGPDFFHTMGARLLRGREFTTSDTPQTPLVAVLSESAVRQNFGGIDAIGRHFSIFDPMQKIEIVGVVADAKLNSLRETSPPIVYLPFLQSEFQGTSDMPASLEIA